MVSIPWTELNGHPCPSFGVRRDRCITARSSHAPIEPSYATGSRSLSQTVGTLHDDSNVFLLAAFFPESPLALLALRWHASAGRWASLRSSSLMAIHGQHSDAIQAPRPVILATSMIARAFGLSVFRLLPMETFFAGQRGFTIGTSTQVPPRWSVYRFGHVTTAAGAVGESSRSFAATG